MNLNDSTVHVLQYYSFVFGFQEKTWFSIDLFYQFILARQYFLSLCSQITRCHLLQLSGAALLGVGIWFKVDKNINSYFDVVDVDTQDPYFDYAVYVLIGFGAFVFLVGFCGCCGAIRESKCLLGFVSFLLNYLTNDHELHKMSISNPVP